MFLPSKIERFKNVNKIVTIVTKMITLLKNGYESILRVFYKDKKADYHLRELARLTKLHEPSVTRFLERLESDNILRSRKDANLKKYSIIKNRNSGLIFEYFDNQRFEELPTIRKNAINTFIQNLREKPIFIVLFGSTAKENYRSESDIDLLLITNNSISTKDAKKETEAMTGLMVSSFQMNYYDFLKELKLKDDKVVQSAINTGYPIYNNLQFYEDVL